MSDLYNAYFYICNILLRSIQSRAASFKSFVMIQARILSAFSKIKKQISQYPSSSANFKPALPIFAQNSMKLIQGLSNNTKRNNSIENQDSTQMIPHEFKQLSKSNGSKQVKTALNSVEDKKKTELFFKEVVQALKGSVCQYHITLKNKISQESKQSVQRFKEIMKKDQLEKLRDAQLELKNIKEKIFQIVSSSKNGCEKAVQQQVKSIKDTIFGPNIVPRPNKIQTEKFRQANHEIISNKIRQYVKKILASQRQGIEKMISNYQSSYKRRISSNYLGKNPIFEENFLETYSANLENLVKYVQDNGLKCLLEMRDAIDEIEQNGKSSYRKSESKKSMK